MVDTNNSSRYIDLLLNKYLVKIGRSANMAWLCFACNNEEETGIAKEFSLHVQCPCRMVDLPNREVLFASLDMYLPNSGTQESENFDWDVQGANRYDAEVKKWLTVNESVYVKKLYFNVLGDLMLFLSNGHIFEVLVTSSLDGEYDECWRFFERHTDRDHFVVNGRKTINVPAADLHYDWR